MRGRRRILTYILKSFEEAWRLPTALVSGMLTETGRLNYASAECAIDLARRELRILGSPVPLGGRAFEIIEVLARSAGELVCVCDQKRLDGPSLARRVMENTLHVQ